MKNKKNRENYYLNVIGIISCRRNKIDTLLSSIKWIGKVLKKNIQFDKKVLYYIEYKYYYMRSVEIMGLEGVRNKRLLYHLT